MKYTKIISLFKENSEKKITVKGWVRTFRANRFIALNDGSTIENIQCVLNFESFDDDFLKKITTGTAVTIEGKLVKSKGSMQDIEIEIEKIEIIGEAAPEDYPIQSKKHSMEFLREKAHLRIRTSTFGAVMRIRSTLAFAVHSFFQKKGFYYINTPIITQNDAEGIGEMFNVSTLDKVANNDYSKDFFGQKSYLTVSGQLEAETYAMGLGEVYTFGPTFRSENSNTSRHLAEFWMIEPEMAFYNLEDNMNLAEEFTSYVLKYILDNCSKDLSFLNDRLIKEEKQKPERERSKMGLIEKIEFTINNKFQRISYTEAINILKNSTPNKKKKFKFIIDKWGYDLQSEHERFLVEKHFNCPVIIFDYPEKIKAFYMRANEDKKTVAAMDVLFPGIGEIIGGSQREERLEVLQRKMKEMKIKEEQLWWYLDLRRFGTVPHSGFGLGFERLVLFATGMSNIRDVIPYPRTPQNIAF